VDVPYGRGDGTFKPATSTLTGNWSLDMLAANPNQNGKPDLATLDEGGLN
jgi:hypothetical protein